MQQKEEQPGWHLEKRVQLSHIVTTLTVAVAAGLYITKLEQRIALIEQRIIIQDQRDQAQDQQWKEAVSTLNVHLARMDGKLDRIIERNTK
jgi:hypothetical protein